MTLVLVSPEGDRRFRLQQNTVLTAGRELACALPILDPRVSRRHAEVRSASDRIELRDLGSRNGTWINGERIELAYAAVGDVVTFGGVSFTVVDADQEPAASAFRASMDTSPTVLRERTMPARGAVVAEVLGRRLAQLIASAQRLGAVSSVEAMLQTIVDDLFVTFTADRVSVLLPDAAGVLAPRIARDRRGDDFLRAVPRAITEGVVERQVALLTHDARADSRTAGDSVLIQAVRSAMAAPLIGEGGVTLGVLYVDNMQDTHAFTDEDLDYLIAYAGLAAVTAEREVTAQRFHQARQIRENFERYFTPQLAERIALESGDVVPGGERRHVVVLFSDIRGFTSIAESLPPLQMAEQLNEYFGVMVDCVFRHFGALDKFIGDALLAYWGAPDAFTDDADRAVAAAIDMQLELTRLNSGWQREGRPQLAIGIGVHCGEAFVGNIGSPRRLEYTLIGDTVNLASRLCDDAGRGEILITDTTRNALLTSRPMLSRADLVPAGRAGPPLRVWSVDTSE